MRLEDFWQVVRTLSREAFLGDYPHPFLLELTETGDRSIPDFKTVHDLRASELAQAPGEPDAGVTGGSRVFAVRKFGSVFPGKMTVGRSKNNDIVINDARVSKLHAYFTAADETFTIVDAESSNGTYHCGTRLPELGKAVLGNRDQVGFGGKARFVFVTPEHFQRRARFLLRGGDA